MKSIAAWRCWVDSPSVSIHATGCDLCLQTTGQSNQNDRNRDWAARGSVDTQLSFLSYLKSYRTDVDGDD